MHFRNDPEYLERTFKGLTSLGSAYSSVRHDDGVCRRFDRYLSANSWCPHFTTLALRPNYPSHEQ